MLYVDGMNGVIGHPETIQWLYTLVGSKVKPSEKEKKMKGCRLSLALSNHPLFGEHYF